MAICRIFYQKGDIHCTSNNMMKIDNFFYKEIIRNVTDLSTNTSTTSYPSERSKQ